MTVTETVRIPRPGVPREGGGAALAARLELPDGHATRPPRAWALFAHCFTCSKESAAAVRISRRLAERGIAVLRFDFTGLGESDGDFADTSFSSNVADLVHAADWMRAEHRAPQLLVGHSLGGAAVLAAAPAIAEVRAVATIGAPSEPEHVAHLFEDELDTIAEEGRARVSIAGRPFTISSEFVADLSRHPLAERVGSLGRALFLFHSPQDETVDVDHARRLYAAAKHPKSFVSLDGANHLLTDRRDAEYVAETLAALVERYLVEEAAAPSSPTPAVPEGHVVVRERDGGLAQDVVAGGHRLAADEPARLGGTDTGPTPYGYLLAALGACTSMTLRMYAKRKEWPLESVEVELAHDRIHLEDCADCVGDPSAAKGGLADRFEVELRITGDLDDGQRARLLEIAHRCPVHRTLLGPKEIDLRLVE